MKDAPTIGWRVTLVRKLTTVELKNMSEDYTIRDNIFYCSSAEEVIACLCDLNRMGICFQVTKRSEEVF